MVCRPGGPGPLDSHGGLWVGPGGRGHVLVHASRVCAHCVWMGRIGKPVIRPRGLDAIGCVEWLTPTSGVARGPEGHLNTLGGGCDVAGAGWDTWTRVQTRVQHRRTSENGLHTYIIKNTAVQQHGAKTKSHANCGQ